MASLTEHVMINKWDDDINNAIVSVGGNTEGSSGLPDYSDIIKSQLTSNKAVGEGIYQDFLYVSENNDTSIYPWDGDPTESTNAPQSTVLAKSIKELYDIMKSTERFKVLLVDELPKSEIDLSAVYLIKESCDCELEHTYSGCYYIKVGKGLKKIDIPEFKVNLDELFFLTRAEYDAGLSDYVKEVEDILRKKFGKYWEDDEFSIEKTIDQIVIDITNELKNTTDKILNDINSKVEVIENKLNTKLDTFEGVVNNQISELDKEIDELNSDFRELATRLTEYVRVDNLITLTDEINELK